MTEKWRLVCVAVAGLFLGAVIGASVMLGYVIREAQIQAGIDQGRRADIRWREIHRPGRLAAHRSSM